MRVGMLADYFDDFDDFDDFDSFTLFSDAMHRQALAMSMSTSTSMGGGQRTRCCTTKTRDYIGETVNVDVDVVPLRAPLPSPDGELLPV